MRGLDVPRLPDSLRDLFTGAKGFTYGEDTWLDQASRYTPQSETGQGRQDLPSSIGKA